MTGRPVLVATHLLAEFSTRAEDLLVAARKVRAREGDEAVHDLRVASSVSNAYSRASVSSSSITRVW